MKFNEFLKTRYFTAIALIIAAIVVLILVFNLGIFIGFNKASFSYRWSENYHKNFAGPRGGFFREFSGKDFIDPHGTIGQIISINDNLIIIKGRDDIEKTILVKGDTIIKRFREIIKIADLATGDFIVVLGQPNDQGQIEAKFIRVMPLLNQKIMNKSYYFSPLKRVE